jgi:hypothetical protein
LISAACSNSQAGDRPAVLKGTAAPCVKFDDRRLTRQAHAALGIFDGKAGRLRELANYLLEREH